MAFFSRRLLGPLITTATGRIGKRMMVFSPDGEPRHDQVASLEPGRKIVDADAGRLQARRRGSSSRRLAARIFNRRSASGQPHAASGRWLARAGHLGISGWLPRQRAATCGRAAGRSVALRRAPFSSRCRSHRRRVAAATSPSTKLPQLDGDGGQLELHQHGRGELPRHPRTGRKQNRWQSRSRGWARPGRED